MRERELEFIKNTFIEKSDRNERISSELIETATATCMDQANIEHISSILELQIITDVDWTNFRKVFESVHLNLSTTLRFRYPHLTQSELQLCVCIKLKLSIKQSVGMRGVSSESVKHSRYRLKKKLMLAKDRSLEDFIKNLDTRKGKEIQDV